MKKPHEEPSDGTVGIQFLDYLAVSSGDDNLVVLSLIHYVVCDDRYDDATVWVWGQGKF